MRNPIVRIVLAEDRLIHFYYYFCVVFADHCQADGQLFAILADVVVGIVVVVQGFEVVGVVWLLTHREGKLYRFLYVLW